MTEQERKEKVIMELKKVLQLNAPDKNKLNTIANLEARLQELTVDDISFVEPIQVYEQKSEFTLDLHVRAKYSDGTLGRDKIFYTNAKYTPEESHYLVPDSIVANLSTAQYELIYKDRLHGGMDSFDLAHVWMAVAEEAKSYFEQQLRAELYNNPAILRPVVTDYNPYESKLVTYNIVPVTFTLKSVKTGETLQVVLCKYDLKDESISFYPIIVSKSDSNPWRFKIYDENFKCVKKASRGFFSSKYSI